MASINIPDILIYLTTNDGLLYYYAQPNSDGTYTLPPPIPTPIPIVNLPINWDKTEIKYSRHPEYLGVFRSQSEQFSFVKDARAILLGLFYSIGGGIQANCKMRIDVFSDINNGYQTAYISEIDFSKPEDKKFNNGYVGVGGNSIKEGQFDVSTLDSRLFTLLQAYGNTVFNIPIWVMPSSDWIPNDGVVFVKHAGIKLLYQASFISSAKDSTPIVYNIPNSTQLNGWNKGSGYGRGDGYHIIPTFTQYNIVQDNGTTTFIGNDILQPFLLQNNQIPGSANFGSENDFDEINHSQPFTKNNYSLKNLLQGISADSVMTIVVSGSFSQSNIPPLNNMRLDYPSGTGYYMSFVLFEINEDDNPTIASGKYVNPLEILRINLPDGAQSTDITVPSFSNVDTPFPFRLKYNKCYVFGIICDNSTGIGSDMSLGFELYDLKFSIKSYYTSGLASSREAPMLNASVFPAMRMYSILDKLVKNLDTTTTNPYGFPIQVTTPLSGISTLLSDPLLSPIKDVVPYQILLTSEYCIHDLQGQSYLSISLNQLFNFCKKTLGCGLAIQTNSTTLEIERLTKYFDKLTQILDLQDNISQLHITSFNEFSGCNLKLGYTKADTNSDFGVDAFNTELFFNTPLTKLSQTIDFEETDILTEQYAIEKLRAQKVTQPIGTAYDPVNPSSSNQNVALYCYNNTVVDGSLHIYKPDNTQFGTSYYPVIQRDGSLAGIGTAQATDSSATTDPYLFGMYFPETAINVELSPCRILQRDCGSLLHSVLDLMDGETLTFRNTYVMQYNNNVVGLSGIESNLVIGGSNPVTTEFKDIQINDLPAKLFRPFIFSIKTVSPVNMYDIMNTNPNGYIKFTWKGVVFKGFIWNISQKLSVSQPTEFELIAHPDTTNSQLINA